MPTAPSEAAVLLSDDRSSLLFPALGLPISIRGVSFRNRIVQAPMCAMYANADGSATRQNVEYYRTRAAGQAGLIIVEITFTDDAGSRAFHAQLGAHDDRMIPGLTDISEAVRAEGAVAGLQLGHVAFFAPDPESISTFYQHVLQFRVSEWIDDFFVFMRCGPDHH
ncbi:MAG: hypothetical protein WAN75_51275, partial [Xanthobacteraceae bacterium]